jgi:hypothetical protein
MSNEPHTIAFSPALEPVPATTASFRSCPFRLESNEARLALVPSETSQSRIVALLNLHTGGASEGESLPGLCLAVAQAFRSPAVAAIQGPFDLRNCTDSSLPDPIP